MWESLSAFEVRAARCELQGAWHGRLRRREACGELANVVDRAVSVRQVRKVPEVRRRDSRQAEGKQRRDGAASGECRRMGQQDEVQWLWGEEEAARSQRIGLVSFP